MDRSLLDFHWYHSFFSLNLYKLQIMDKQDELNYGQVVIFNLNTDIVVFWNVVLVCSYYIFKGIKTHLWFILSYSSPSDFSLQFCGINMLLCGSLLADLKPNGVFCFLVAAVSCNCHVSILVHCTWEEQFDWHHISKQLLFSEMVKTSKPTLIWCSLQSFSICVFYQGKSCFV